MSSEIHVAVSDRPETLRFADTVRIGRAETNAIVMTDDVVSGEHLELRKSGDGWELVDLGSTNGTFIDGERVTRAPLGPLTAVRLGPGGPKLHLTIPGQAARVVTRAVGAADIADRYLGDQAPVGMSPRTGFIRQALQERRAAGDLLLVETHSPSSHRGRDSGRGVGRGRWCGRVAGATRRTRCVPPRAKYSTR